MSNEGSSPVAPSEEPKTEEWYKYLVITTKGVAIVGYTPRSSTEIFKDANANGGRCSFRVAALADSEGKPFGGVGNDAVVMLHDISYMVSQEWTDADHSLVSHVEADAEPESGTVDLRFGR